MSFKMIGKGTKVSFKTNSGATMTRNSTNSAVAGAAYRSGLRLVETFIENGETKTIVHNYQNKRGVVHSEILAPEFVSKESWVFDRQKLWNKVQQAETKKNDEFRKDAQFSREFEIALPKELTVEENIELFKNFVTENFVELGMVADINIHYDNPENPHAHCMLTTRELVVSNEELKFVNTKNRGWNKTEVLQFARKSWADSVNRELDLRGFESRITELSFKELGISLKPTVHEGPARYITNSELVQRNKEILEFNTKSVASEPELLIGAIDKIAFTKFDLQERLQHYLTKNLEINSDDAEGSKKLEQSLTSAFLFGMEKILSSESIVSLNSKGPKGQNLYTSASRLELEQNYMNLVESLHCSKNHMIANFQIQKGLSVQQANVVKGILSGNDISVVEGLPGTGKTTTLRSVVTNFKNSGYRVFGAAPTAAAARNLAEIGDLHSETVAKYLFEWNRGRALFASEKTVLIVDEMSMVDLSSMHKLLKEIFKVGGKLVLVGDNNQFGAIHMKGASQRATDICGSLKLDEVRRQENPLHKAATKYLANFEIEKAFDLYSKTGAFKIFQTQNQSMLALAKDFVREFKNNSKLENAILAHTKATVKKLNGLVRLELQKADLLSKEEYECLFASKINVSIGERVVLGKNNRTLKVCNGDVAIVKEIGVADSQGHREISLQMKDQNRLVRFNTKDYDEVSLGYALTAHKAQGKTYDLVSLFFEKSISFNTLVVMLTRHKTDVKFFADLENLKVFATKFDTKLNSLELLKKAVLFSAGSKESNMFASDYFDQEKIEKVLDFVEARNFVKSRVNDFSSGNFKNLESSKMFFEKLNQRNFLAKYLQENFSIFKDFCANAKINMVDLQKFANQSLPNSGYVDKANDVISLRFLIENLQNQPHPELSKQLSSWFSFHKSLKEQNLLVQAKLAIKSEAFELISHDLNVLQELNKKIANLDWQKNFKYPLSACKNLEKLQESQNFVNLSLTEKENFFQNLAGAPEKLAKLAGLSFFGFQTAKYLESKKLAAEYFSMKAIYCDFEQKLQKHGDVVEIRKDLEQLETSAKELSSLLATPEEWRVAAQLSKYFKASYQNPTFKGAPNIDTRNLDETRGIKNVSTTKQFAQKILEQYSGVKQNSFEQKAWLDFREIQSLLTHSDIEQIFRANVKNINSTDEVIVYKDEIHCGSLFMNLKTGMWNRFSANKGGNIFHFLEETTGCTKREALENIASLKGRYFDSASSFGGSYLKPVEKIEQKTETHLIDKKQSNEWTMLSPAPENIHLSKSDLSWFKQEIEDLYEYRSANGQLIGYVIRSNSGDGQKTQLPLAYCLKAGRAQWRVQNFGTHCFGAEKLLNDSRDILFVEGEKTAVAAQRLLPEYAVLAFPGATKVKQIDWSILPVEGRNIAIWPDNDKPGMLAAQELKTILDSKNDVAIIAVEKLNLPLKWDLADPIPSTIDIKNIIQEILPEKETPGNALEFSDALKLYVKDASLSQVQMLIQKQQNQPDPKEPENLVDFAQRLNKNWQDKFKTEEPNQQVCSLKALKATAIELALIEKTTKEGKNLVRCDLTKQTEAFFAEESIKAHQIFSINPLIQAIRQIDPKLAISVAEQVFYHEAVHGKASLTTPIFEKIVATGKQEIQVLEHLQERFTEIFKNQSLEKDQVGILKNFCSDAIKLSVRSQNWNSKNCLLAFNNAEDLKFNEKTLENIVTMAKTQAKNFFVENNLHHNHEKEMTFN